MSRSKTGRRKPMENNGVLNQRMPIPAASTDALRRQHALCSQRLREATAAIQGQFEAFAGGIKAAMGAPENWVLHEEDGKLYFIPPPPAPEPPQGAPKTVEELERKLAEKRDAEAAKK